MTTSDRSQQPLTPVDQRAGFAGTVRDELARLRGRQLGVCAACGHPVFFEHNFTRFRGRVVHVRCPISALISSSTQHPVVGRFAAHDR